MEDEKAETLNKLETKEKLMEIEEIIEENLVT